MPFEQISAAPKRIAVIGAGISGLAAAHLLSRRHRVTLIEAEPRLGGHARTILAGKRGDQPVDTGFIVFNKTNYPHLTQLFEELDVPLAPSNMSFGVSIGGGALEYALRSFDTIFAQRRNLGRPAFLRMIRDILRFNERAFDASRDRCMTIRDLLDNLRTGPWFRDYYLLPFSGAIWSTPKEKVLEFPAYAMMEFFRNHALLGYTGQHQWHTVRGGSVEYVNRLGAALRRAGVEVRTGTPVAGVRRYPDHVEIRAEGGAWERFDEVVFATHSDDTLRLLSDAGARERATLGAIAYQPNEVVLHADTRMMPRRPKVWSSWVYSEDAARRSEQIDLTYWMNSLQPIPKDDPHFVTLNSKRTIREELIYDSTVMRHPVYTAEALDSQAEVAAFNGTNRTWFCGAWMKNGFHEDGLASAVDVADAIDRLGTLHIAAE